MSLDLEPELVHDRSEHATTPYYAQCSQIPRFSVREMKEEEMSEKGTLSNFMQEYESQTEKFGDHITLKEFYKIKMERS